MLPLLPYPTTLYRRDRPGPLALSFSVPPPISHERREMTPAARLTKFTRFYRPCLLAATLLAALLAASALLAATLLATVTLLATTALLATLFLALAAFTFLSLAVCLLPAFSRTAGFPRFVGISLCVQIAFLYY